MRMRTQAPSVAPLSSCCSTSSSSSSSSSTSSGSNSLFGSDQDDDQHWRNFDNSVSAVSFGLVATAILISMFLVMALFERFLRPPSSSAAVPPSTGGRSPHESHHGKLEYPSPKVNIYAREVSVLMPGEENPTYIANPVPSVCPP